MLLVCGKPMIRREENAIAIFNEIMVSIYLLASIALTDYLGPNPKRAECGMALVCIVLFTFAVNLIKFLVIAKTKIAQIWRMRKKRTIPVMPSENVKKA